MAIVDQYGRPIKADVGARSRRSMYPSISEHTGQYWSHYSGQDAKTFLSGYKTEQLRNDARRLYTRDGSIAGAIHKKATYSVGQAWEPFYCGLDEEFREKSKILMERWVANCDVSGRFSWDQMLWMASTKLDYDGDLLIVTANDRFGLPRLQLIEANNINGPNEGKIKDGQFAGMNMSGGVVYDDVYTPIAYCVDAKEKRFVSARSAYHIFEPKWPSQVRGIPALSHGLLDWYDISEIRGNELTAQKMYSTMAIIESDDSGMAEASAAASSLGGGTSSATPGLAIKEFYRGMIQHVKSGNKIEAFTSDRPSPAWQGFMEHVMRCAFAGLGLPYEFGFDASSLGGAAVRGMVGEVNRTIKSRQNTLWKAAQWLISYPVASWIKAGLLKPVPDWDKWDFNYPSSYSVDVGRDRQNAREDFILGLNSLSELFAENGTTVERVANQRADDWLTINNVSKSKGVPLEVLLDTRQVLVGPADPVSDSEETK